MSAIYAYPQTGRAGLGNMLFPWARAEQFRYLHHLAMLSPQWTQPKVGPILRRERDKRFYTRSFQSDSYIYGLKKWWILLTSSRISENDVTAIQQIRGSKVVVFSGLGNYFQDFLGNHNLIVERLNKIIRPHLLQSVEHQANEYGPFIAAHVRRGDMQYHPMGIEAPANTRYAAISIDWYIKVIEQIRKHTSSDLKVVVFSDGHDHELRDLLQIPHVVCAKKQPAIADIMLMSKAKVLIATSGSTFSAWSAFIGKVPFITFPIPHSFNMVVDKQNFEYFTDIYGNISQPFGAICKTALAKLG